MKRKGFTLIELLAVIVILGILSAIIVISVTSVLEKSSNDAIDVLKKEVENAARKYVVENIDTVINGNKIFVRNLIDEGYLKEIKDPNDKEISCYNNSNPMDNSTIENDSYVDLNITELPNDNSKYSYTVTIQCFPTGESSYTLQRSE